MNGVGGWLRGGALWGWLLAALAGCTIQQKTPRLANEQRGAKGGGGDTAQLSLRAPADSEIPDGPLGAAIRRGRALMRNTRDSLPQHASSALRCFSCHLGEGTQANALPLIGVYSRFPQYRPRNALVNLLEDRINDCFERSLNGKALPREGREMRELIAYFAFISRGVAPPGALPGGGGGLRLLDPLPSDTLRGREVFVQACARCHGSDGLGTPVAPPLWGPRSFNIGAGMARLRTAAAFIRVSMPNDGAVVLTDQQAYDVAAYVLSRPRPDFAKKALDWPKGDAPEDSPYPTRAVRRPAVP